MLQADGKPDHQVRCITCSALTLEASDERQRAQPLIRLKSANTEAWLRSTLSRLRRLVRTAG